MNALPTKDGLDIFTNIPSLPILQTRQIKRFAPILIPMDPSNLYRGDLRLSFVIRLDSYFMEFSHSRAQILSGVLIMVYRFLTVKLRSSGSKTAARNLSVTGFSGVLRGRFPSYR